MSATTTTITTAAAQPIIHAYRHLFKATLHGVRYSVPARYIVRDHIRSAFRTSPSSDFNQHKIDRTLEFLHAAGAARGIEHKVLKNLMMVWWHREKVGERMGVRSDVKPFWNSAYDDFDKTIAKLNESMGMCIK